MANFVRGAALAGEGCIDGSEVRSEEVQRFLFSLVQWSGLLVAECGRMWDEALTINRPMAVLECTRLYKLIHSVVVSRTQIHHA